MFLSMPSKLSQRTKWINPVFFFFFEKDLPLKPEYEKKLKGSENTEISCILIH